MLKKFGLLHITTFVTEARIKWGKCADMSKHEDLAEVFNNPALMDGVWYMIKKDDKLNVF